jgi:hypothetical protein
MDAEDLDHINQLLDHDVELREVFHASRKSKPSWNSCILSPRKLKTKSLSWTKRRVRWSVCSTRSTLHRRIQVRTTWDTNSSCCSVLKCYFDPVPALLDSVRPVLHGCREATASLAALVPANQFWRWKDQWANSLRTAIFAASLVEYLTSGKLISLSHVGDILGSKHSYFQTHYHLI